jgi:hypothetical protein
MVPRFFTMGEGGFNRCPSDDVGRGKHLPALVLPFNGRIGVELVPMGDRFIFPLALSAAICHETLVPVDR